MSDSIFFTYLGPGLGDEKEDDGGKDKAGNRIAGKEDEIRTFGQKAPDGRADGHSQVEDNADEPVGAGALIRLHQVGDHSLRSGAKERKEQADEGGHGNKGSHRVHQPHSKARHSGQRQPADHQRLAPKTVSQRATHSPTDQPHPTHNCHQPADGRHRDVESLAHVKGEEGVDERTTR